MELLSLYAQGLIAQLLLFRLENRVFWNEDTDLK